MNRRLYRCRHDRRIAGVAAGIAEYFDADPTIVRLLWVVSIFFGGFGLLLYIAMALIVPNEPFTAEEAAAAAPGGWVAPSGWVAPEPHRHVSRGSGRGMTFVGLVLILFGALALVDAYLPGWADHGRFLWPAFILGIGGLLVVMAVRREPDEPSMPIEPGQPLPPAPPANSQPNQPTLPSEPAQS